MHLIRQTHAAMKALQTIRALLCCALMCGASFAEAESLLVLYSNKPPLYFTQNEQPVGILLQRVQERLRKAGITPEYMEWPAKRIIDEIARNQRPLCSLGWFKTAERELFARFSAPIYQDPPFVVVARSEKHSRFTSYRSLRELLQDDALSATLIDGISYGQRIDEWLKSSKINIERAAIEPMLTLQKVEKRRADLTIVTGDEFEYFQQQHPDSKLGAYVYPDIDKGEKRHLMCTRQVPTELIQRFNATASEEAPGTKRGK